MKSVAYLLTLATVCAATVLPQPLDKRNDIWFKDTFDERNVTATILGSSAVGLYHDLQYGGARINRPLATSGLSPRSGAQFALTTVVTDIRAGNVTLAAFNTLTRGPGVKSFDLQSFYWGLETGLTATSTLAQAGTISVTAYDLKGNKISETFGFVPARLVQAPLHEVILSKRFEHLQNATFAVESAELTTLRANVALDDVVHVNHY
ncbi:hypothetical protein K461DRAFT_297267 [Myriangium duriaei CBS 260.36]|uniref:Uncharacterized protein n=1 Tax=Myriangium duriaei CBS 260.36 TaxID=1168546 RepID=A0A9P4MCI1_9PEZI|nr:hypothetical protein K461DRAFT_297267 [Myriangium duriaei CBS 260.36]